MSEEKSRGLIKYPEGSSFVIESLNKTINDKSVKGISRTKLYDLMGGYYRQTPNWQQYKKDLLKMREIYSKKLELLEESYKTQEECIQGIFYAITQSIKVIDEENRI